MINKKNIYKSYYLFLFLHFSIWTAVPYFSNINLPLDTIEVLAWGSDLKWGYSKHPPLSAFFAETFFQIFGNQDWAFYLLSQIFVLTAFIAIFELSNSLLENKNLALISILLLEGIYFYNFTSPEFNVNVSQLPFWALSILFSYRCLKLNQTKDYIFLGIFLGLGVLSKYLFIYLASGIYLSFFYFYLNEKKDKLLNVLLSGIIFLIILMPHLFWLSQNDFSTISYGFKRTGGVGDLTDHLIYPILFFLKQLGILIPFFIMGFCLINKFTMKINLKDKKILFLNFTVTVPIILMIITSIIMGAKIRTMWMTPFYLAFGTLFLMLFKKQVNLKKLKKFYLVFLFIFSFSPFAYLTISLLDDTKRTDYPGKEISRLVQNKWNDNFVNDIKIVIGDEWSAGNLSYHLKSRPVWVNDLKKKGLTITDDQGVIYTGNPKILKKVCPGVFGSIKPVGYCMIGKR